MKCMACIAPAVVRFDAIVDWPDWYLCGYHALEILGDDPVRYYAIYRGLAS